VIQISMLWKALGLRIILHAHTILRFEIVLTYGALQMLTTYLLTRKLDKRSYLCTRKYYDANSINSTVFKFLSA